MTSDTTVDKFLFNSIASTLSSVHYCCAAGLLHRFLSPPSPAPCHGDEPRRPGRAHRLPPRPPLSLAATGCNRSSAHGVLPIFNKECQVSTKFVLIHSFRRNILCNASCTGVAVCKYHAMSNSVNKKNHIRK